MPQPTEGRDCRGRSAPGGDPGQEVALTGQTKRRKHQKEVGRLYLTQRIKCTPAPLGVPYLSIDVAQHLQQDGGAV